MAYWPAGVSQLDETVAALSTFVNSRLVEGGREAAKLYYNARGFTTHGFTDIHAAGAVLGSPMWGLSPACGAWLTLSLYEHYRFTMDLTFLTNQALPALREAASFLLDYAVVNDYPERSGNNCPYLFGPAVSPENSYVIKPPKNSYVINFTSPIWNGDTDTGGVSAQSRAEYVLAHQDSYPGVTVMADAQQVHELTTAANDRSHNYLVSGNHEGILQELRS